MAIDFSATPAAASSVSWRSIASEKKQRDGNRCPDQGYINPCAAFGLLPRCISSLGAFESLRRYLENPRQNQRDRKTDDDEQHEQPNHPDRNIEDRKDLRDSLRKSPARHNVSDGHLVHVAPLQLAEEYLRIHRTSLLALIFRRE